MAGDLPMAAAEQTIKECLNAIVNGPFLDEFEFQTRMGLSREEMSEVLRLFPMFSGDDDGSATIAVNNCLNEISYGITISDQLWSKWFSMSREEVRKTFADWAKSRGWGRTGVM